MREVNPDRAIAQRNAEETAEEWVTPMRLIHVLDKLPQGISIESTREVIKAMMEDVYREGSDEVKESKENNAAIGKKAAKIFREYLNSKINLAI